MKKYTILTMPFERRTVWQNNTIRKVQEEMHVQPEGILDVADYEKSLVVIYGDTQIGKTTLILNLIGILPEYRDQVYKLLRARQEYGDSSTSNATIYCISPSEKYGISFISDDEEKSVNRGEIQYYDEEAVVQALADMRNEIESGQGKEGILYFYIPKTYFPVDITEQDLFSIMDLPGINSKNINETDYVEKTVFRYMSMATVKIVVTKGDSIQNLEYLEVPEGINWRMFPNRYLVVVTTAFSQGSVKNYFDQEKKDRQCSFAEYIKNAYSEIPEIVKSDELEWYPIDIGDSYFELIKAYPSEEEEIEETRKLYLNQIKEAVLKRKGNGLRNIIEDLKSYSKDYYRVNKQKIELRLDELSKQNTINKQKRAKAQEDLKNYELMLSEFPREDIKIFSEIDNFEVANIKSELNTKIETFISELPNKYPPKIPYQDFKIVEDYQKFVKDAEQCVDIIKPYIGDERFKEKYSSDEAKMYFDKVEQLLKSQSGILRDLLSKKIFGFKKKTKSSRIVEEIREMSDKSVERILQIVSDLFKDDIQELKENKNKYSEYQALIDRKNEDIESATRSIEQYDDKRKSLELCLKDWTKKEEDDQKLLKAYLRIGQEEYKKEKNDIKSEMKDMPLNQKLQYTVLLGLMEKDYNTIIQRGTL